ncbi:MAG: hypothetical protein IKI72_05725 [Bacteroidales bacterium]|nr:hypothetical protein [Bacteroidales bacterium]
MSEAKVCRGKLPKLTKACWSRPNQLAEKAGANLPERSQCKPAGTSLPNLPRRHPPEKWTYLPEVDHADCRISGAEKKKKAAVLVAFFTICR